MYFYIILFSHPAIFKQIFSLKLILGQRYPNNWFHIGRWSITNKLHQYCVIIGCQYETNVMIGYEKPIYNGPINSSHIMLMPRLPMGNQYWANIHAVWVAALLSTNRNTSCCMCDKDICRDEYRFVFSESSISSI